MNCQYNFSSEEGYMPILLAIRSFWGIREPLSALTHALGAVLGVIALYVLIRQARKRNLDLNKQLGLWAFGVSMILLYTASALFHWLRLPREQLELFNKIDHAGIFLFIAGTFIAVYTIVERKEGHRGYWIRGMGLLTVVAFVLQLFVLATPRWLTTSVYLSMGWVGTTGIMQGASSDERRQMRLFLYGMGIYSIAAFMYALRRPVIWPGYFEAHELFHVVVMVGSMLHFRFLYRYRMQP